MRVIWVALATLVLAFPVLAFSLYATRLLRSPPGEDAVSERPAGYVFTLVVSVILGAVAFVAAWSLERWVLAWAGLEVYAHGSTDLPAVIYAFCVAAPLEQGLKVAAVVPAWRNHRLGSRRDGYLLGGAAALGFITAHSGNQLISSGATYLDLVRCFGAAPAHVFFGAMWGYALGRDAERRGFHHFGGPLFNGTWLLCVLFNGVFDHILFARSAAAMVATLPILGAMVAIAGSLTKSVAARPSSRRLRQRFTLAPPSVGAVRAAFSRGAEEPLMVSWILGGILVNIGVMTTGLALAVLAGNRIGVDFGAVDRSEATGESAAPLILLATSTLAAFPFSGYLITRASGARSVLEATVAAVLAIVVVLVLMGLAAPIAVVFIIAFAPIALGLAGLGAWFGVQE